MKGKKTFLLTVMMVAAVAVGLILAGCSGPGSGDEMHPTASPVPEESPTLTLSPPEPSVTPSPAPEDNSADDEAAKAEAAATAEPAADEPAPSPTQDPRLPPEEWRSWPVIPTLSPAMIEVYQRGLAMGNRPDRFSKVGDCQIIPKVFLGLYDQGTYNLPEDLTHLETNIDQFSGSFAREGMALKGGFVFPTVFSPLRADASVCEPGETPYECELRVHQPSFVLISMEFRYEGRTAETHERYLRKAVEYALARGIVPILATKADNFEGDHSLNLTTAQIAYEYDLPLFNYWLAVQPLPDHGIDWERDSYGFHVTPEAWLVRSRTFLRVLDALWRQAEQAVNSGSGA